MTAAQIFKQQYGVDTSGFYTTYRVRLQNRGLIVGGVPGNASVIRSWLTAKMELGDASLEELLAETVKARDTSMSVEEKVDALTKSPVAPSINGFKRNEAGFLTYEGRCAKAALKEAANSSFPGTDWPGKKDAKGIAPRKGLMSTMVERVFIPELYISLGVHEHDRVEEIDLAEGKWTVQERVKHVMTAQGPRSAINLCEVVLRPTLEFHVRVHDDFLSPEAWAKIWVRSEDIGIGADRGRSDGSFDMLDWTVVGQEELTASSALLQQQ